MSRHVVAKADEVAPGERKLVNVKGRDIGIFNVNGAFYALANKCPHAGGSLCEGTIIALVLSERPGHYSLARHGEFLRCPWHGWEFEISSGQSWCDPQNLRVRQFNISVESGETLVKGPYVAETFPVSVEANYIVIDL
jgi:3-phenylpropionate/trans-cinnamate dioxygenase ferredoxin subunit